MEERPRPPLAGIVYGDFAYWIALAGMVIGIIGIILYLGEMNQFVDAKLFLSQLWSAKTAPEIWKMATGKLIHGHWYLHKLSYSDGLAMLGVGICCLSAVFGMWASCITMLTGKGKIGTLFFILAAVVTVILTLSALGIIALHH